MSSRSRAFRPRGHRPSPSSSGRSFRSGYVENSRPPPADLMRDLNPVAYRTIDVPSVDSMDDSVEITDVEPIGSYDWVEDPLPTIRVPGSPPEWCDVPTPFEVAMDIALLPNYQPFPTMPLLPLFYAVDALRTESAKPAIDWSLVDFVSDRNGLSKLLRWIDSPSMPSDDFRIDLWMAGKRTVMFNRWGYVEQLYPNTYGYNFKQRTTKPAAGCEQSIRHHRIVKYNLDGLSMVVRSQVDACMPQRRSEPTIPSSTAIDDLSTALSALNIKQAQPSPRPTTNIRSPIKILHGGNFVPQADLIELTTVSYKRADTFDSAGKYLQCFLSQTTHLFRGVHARGLFSRVEKRRLDSDFKQAARNAQSNLRKLKAVLVLIQGIMIENGPQGRLSLVCQNGVLKVFSRESQADFLTREIMTRFDT